MLFTNAISVDLGLQMTTERPICNIKQAVKVLV